MKVTVIVGAVLIVGAALLFATSPTVPPGTTAQAQKLSFATIESDVRAGASLIDVRTPAEYKSGYIESAVNLPLNTIRSGSVPANPKDAKLYVYCQSGNRSAQAKIALDEAGFKNVIDLGGINAVLSLGAKQVR